MLNQSGGPGLGEPLNVRSPPYHIIVPVAQYGLPRSLSLERAALVFLLKMDS